MTLLVFILVLSVLILVHEFGHFIVAKKSGIRVEEFALGFPPAIFRKKIGETIYSINALPFGGYVRLFGEDAPTEKDKKHSFFDKPPLIKLAVVLAGVFMNFLLASFLFSFLYLNVGIPQSRVSGPVISGVSEGSPASLVGLRSLDRVVSVDGAPVSTVAEFQDMVKARAGEEVDIKIVRSGLVFLTEGIFQKGSVQTVDVKVVPRRDPPQDQGALGVGVDLLSVTTTKFFPWYEMLPRTVLLGFLDTVKISAQVFLGLGDMIHQILFSGSLPKGVAGPIGIFQITGVISKAGMLPLISFVGMMSVNLGVLNLLPIPGLDGGRAFIIAIQSLVRRKMSPAFEQKIQIAGLTVLVGLIVVVTFHDLLRLLRGQGVETLFGE